MSIFFSCVCLFVCVASVALAARCISLQDGRGGQVKQGGGRGRRRADLGGGAEKGRTCGRNESGGETVVVIWTECERKKNCTECYQVNTCNAKTMLEKKSKRPKGKDRKRKKIPIKVPQTSSCLQVTHNKWRGRGSEKLGSSIQQQLQHLTLVDNCQNSHSHYRGRDTSKRLETCSNTVVCVF